MMEAGVGNGLGGVKYKENEVGVGGDNLGGVKVLIKGGGESGWSDERMRRRRRKRRDARVSFMSCEE